MLRIIGALVLSAAACLYGFFISTEIKRKIAAEDGFLMLITYIKIMISAGNMPLNKISSGFSNGELERNGFLNDLRNGGCNAFYEIMTKKGTEYIADREIRELIVSFSGQIGACPLASDGVRLCEKYISLVENRISGIRENDKTRALLSKKLGIIAGAFILVMFI